MVTSGRDKIGRFDIWRRHRPADPTSRHLMENAERALQHVAVLDKERKPTGEYRYDGNAANRALELLGKQQGMFIDRHEVGQPNEFANWTDEELRAFIKSGTRPLGIVSGKTQH
jgi:hypothetical protein